MHVGAGHFSHTIFCQVRNSPSTSKRGLFANGGVLLDPTQSKQLPLPKKKIMDFPLPPFWFLYNILRFLFSYFKTTRFKNQNAGRFLNY